MSTLTGTGPVTIDNIDRPCVTCDSINTHYAEDSHGDAHTYIPAQFTYTTPAWDAVYAEARRLGWPEHYTVDLFRDYQTIVQHRWGTCDQFIWRIEAWGTHIVRLDYTPLPKITYDYNRVNATCECGWTIHAYGPSQAGYAASEHTQRAHVDRAETLESIVLAIHRNFSGSRFYHWDGKRLIHKETAQSAALVAAEADARNRKIEKSTPTM